MALDLKKLPKTTNGEIDFKQDFFGEKTFLTGTGQLNVESIAWDYLKVYTFGPTFWAEKLKYYNTSCRILDGRKRNCFWWFNVKCSSTT